MDTMTDLNTKLENALSPTATVPTIGGFGTALKYSKQGYRGQDVVTGTESELVATYRGQGDIVLVQSGYADAEVDVVTSYLLMKRT
jgi:hypothetical protein